MAADVLMANATSDTTGAGVSMRVIGTQIPPAKMSVQIAISGKARMQIKTADGASRALQGIAVGAQNQRGLVILFHQP